MAVYIQRREFIGALGGALVAWPLGAHAQQPIGKIRNLGLLLPGLPEASMSKATRDRLRELGYTEGRDIVLEARWANGKMERLNELAAELARLQLAAIIAYTTPGAIAARKATTTIPIVFLFVGDPVGAGVVPSLAHPGGNATGLSLLATELSGKRLEILLEIAPKTSRVAMLWNDANTGMVLRAARSNWFHRSTRGDPELALRWTCKSLRRLEAQARGQAFARKIGVPDNFPIFKEMGYILEPFYFTISDRLLGHRFGIGYQLRTPGCFKENHGYLEFGESGQMRLNIPPN